MTDRLDGVAARLRNDRGEYPGEGMRWGFGLLYMAGIPFGYFALRGEFDLALVGGGLGVAALLYLALLGWWLEV